ncbi:WD40 repeat-like protein [Acaromyces ingoldii]|uniref:Probable cytosolic iron-sulfur protein assembly protein 1 n=1 Tax=Acaromyces ingoldii TaxID=215250 RepID=A0A316YZ66_9BASI|nr:WD40 repeat-like protein [Acaromyces ingoldii]PWN93115.1 WD40 repeat-like protein [Acaromyces ingoldii]
MAASSFEPSTGAPGLTLVTGLAGHSDRAWSLAWNPTMPILASCSSDKDVRLFSYRFPKIDPTSSSDVDMADAGQKGEQSKKPLAPTFELKETIPTGHRRTVRDVAWHPSGKSLATASFDSTVGIWERVADVMAAAGGGQSRHDDDEDEVMARGSENKDDGGAEWDCIGTLEGHDSECKAVGFSYTGGLLASCSRDKSVWVWEVQGQAEFECLSVLMEHSQDVKTLAWHPKEELLASASYDDTIRLYVDDPSDDWFCYTILTGHEATVWSLAFSPCGNFLASASDDCTVRIWRRLTAAQAEERGLKANPKGPGREGDRWHCVRIIKGWHTRTIYSVSWGGISCLDEDQQEGLSTSLGNIATAGGDGQIVVFQVSLSDSEASMQSGQKGGHQQVDLAPKVELIARQYEAHGDADVNCVCFAPTKLQRLRSFIEEEEEAKIKIKELSESEIEHEHQRSRLERGTSGAEHGDDAVMSLGGLLASAADDGTLKVWSIPRVQVSSPVVDKAT